MIAVVVVGDDTLLLGLRVFRPGYKTDSPTSSPQEIRPPPGFNFIDNEAALRAGIDFFKLESCQPAGKMDSSPNQ